MNMIEWESQQVDKRSDATHCVFAMTGNVEVGVIAELKIVGDSVFVWSNFKWSEDTSIFDLLKNEIIGIQPI